MDKYNYQQAMRDDVMQYIRDNYTREELKEHLATRQQEYDFEETLNNEMWVCDSVTGNASGSYTFNRWVAKEYVEGNLDILREAIEEFCVEPKNFMEKFLDEEWEHFDVTIRCYLLSGAIYEALSELEDELEEDFEKCSFCSEWFEKSELHDGLCTYCQQEIKSRGEGIRK